MEQSSNPNRYLTWFEVVVFLGSLFFFSVHDHLRHCCGSVKRVKKEDKATAGYRLSNSQQSLGRHLESQTIFTPDYRVSNQAITRGTSHFLRPTQTNAQLSCSLRATQVATAAVPPTRLNSVNNLSMQTRRFTREHRQSTNNEIWFFFVSGHIYSGEATNRDLYTVSVKACQSECASPGGGEITEERRGAAGCQSKDLYRAVAAAETDIGRHGMHDKSRWTGGTRLKKQEKAESWAEAGRRQSGILLLCDLEKRSRSSHFTHNKFHHFALMPTKVI